MHRQQSGGNPRCAGRSTTGVLRRTQTGRLWNAPESFLLRRSLTPRAEEGKAAVPHRTARPSPLRRYQLRLCVEHRTNRWQADIQHAAYSFVHHFSGGTDDEPLDGRKQVLAMALTQRITSQLTVEILDDLGDVVPVNHADRAQFIVEAKVRHALTFQRVLSENRMEAQDIKEQWVLLAKLFMTTLDGLVETAIVAASHADAARLLSTTASPRDAAISNLEPTTAKVLADVMEKLTDHVTKPKSEVSKQLADSLRYKKALDEKMESLYDVNGLLKSREELYEVLKSDRNFMSTGNLSQFVFLVRQSLSLAPYVRNNDDRRLCYSWRWVVTRKASGKIGRKSKISLMKMLLLW
mgnify:CR=1 FL=1